MAKKIFTYKTIPQDTFEITWFIYDRKVKNNAEIKTWKKNAPLKLHLDIYTALQDLNNSITPGANVDFLINYHSIFSYGGTGLQGNVYSTPYSFNNTDKSMDFSIDCEIPGEKIAGALEISFLVCLTNSEASDISIYATKPGSILYEEKILVYLEGNQALFPVKAIDFSKDDRAFSNSLYFLQRKYSQLDSNFNSAYKLYFNTSHPLFNKINDDNLSDSSNQYILKLIMLDVYRTILLDALDDDRGLKEIYESTSDNENYTLKAVYSRIVHQMQEFFPDKDLDGLKGMIHGDEYSRNKIFTALQDFIIN